MSLIRLMTSPCAADNCDGLAEFKNGCGAYVCGKCGHHTGLCRCFCGWAASGGDGHRELIEAGETIDPDE